MRHRLIQSAVIFMLIVFGLTFLSAPVDARDANGVWSVLDVGAGNRPSMRKHHTMVYVPASAAINHGRVILYGGENKELNSEEPFNDLWVLHLTANPYWQQIPSQPTWPKRHGHSAAVDLSPSARKMFMVFGRSEVNQPSNPGYTRDSWILDVDSYALSSGPPLPPSVLLCTLQGNNVYGTTHARSHSAAAVLNGSLWVMGGMVGAATAPDALHDTWELSGSWNHRWGRVVSGVQPPDPCAVDGNVLERLWHTMVSTGTRVIIFGGWYPGEFGSFSDMWATDGTLTNGKITWTDLPNGPTARTFHSAVWDEVGERMIVTGGYTAPGLPSEVRSSIASDVLTFTFSTSDPDTGSWDTLSPSGCGPGAIAEHSTVYDSDNDRMIVFGGVDGTGEFIPNDVHVLLFDTPAVPPSAGVTLSAGQIGRTSSTITWTAPASSGSCGPATGYDLRRSLSTINEANFCSATRIDTDSPSAAGTGECATSWGLTQCQTYFYALKTTYGAGCVSAMSNVISIKQKCSGGSYMCEGGGLLTVETPQATPQAVEYAIRGANPASSATTLFVGVPADRQGEAMEISIYDVTGARIRTLVRRSAAPGDAEFTWDHRTDAGVRVAGGVYFARLSLGNETRTHKVVVTIGR